MSCTGRQARLPLHGGPRRPRYGRHHATGRDSMRRLVLGGILVSLLVPAAVLAAGHTPRTYGSTRGRPLTTPSRRSPPDIVLDFLRARGLAADAGTVRAAS